MSMRHARGTRGAHAQMYCSLSQSIPVCCWFCQLSLVLSVWSVRPSVAVCPIMKLTDVFTRSMHAHVSNNFNLFFSFDERTVDVYVHTVQARARPNSRRQSNRDCFFTRPSIFYLFSVDYSSYIACFLSFTCYLNLFTILSYHCRPDWHCNIG